MTSESSRAKGTEPAYPIASVDNALRLLRMFGTQPIIRLSEASQMLGVAHSTAHRLLAMLAYHDLVRRDPRTRAYTIGPALIEIGLAAVAGMDVRTTLRPVLDVLASELNETTHLAVLEGSWTHYVDGIESTKAVRVATRTGRLMPAHCTAVGKAMLATLSLDELRRAYPDEVLEQTTHKSLRSRIELEQHLEKVRRLGYAINREESEEGVTAVGIAVRVAGSHGVVAGLGVAAPTRRMLQLNVSRVARLIQGVLERLGVELASPAVGTLLARAERNPD